MLGATLLELAMLVIYYLAVAEGQVLFVAVWVGATRLAAFAAIAGG